MCWISLTGIFCSVNPSKSTYRGLMQGLMEIVDHNEIYGLIFHSSTSTYDTGTYMKDVAKTVMSEVTLVTRV